jgi:acyl-CoA synthetase (AMP-forming)/AMP-acid ligase II
MRAKPLTSPTVRVDFDQMPTLGDIARYHARERPAATALTFEGRSTTFADFQRHTNQVANALSAQRVGRGDRLAYIGKNSDHYFEILIGAAKVGAVLTPIGWRLAPAEMTFIVENARARIVFVGPEFMSQVPNILANLDSKPEVVAMEVDASGEFQPYEAWRSAADDVDPSRPIDPNAVALQLYTSGTTGRPKGAMLTHTNLLIGRRLASESGLPAHTWTPDDIGLVAMPVGHIGGTIWGIIGLYNGAKGVVAREFDPIQALDHIEHDRISKLLVVPAALQIMVRQPRVREVDFSRLQYITYGASPIPLALLREAMEVFGCGFCQVYGMTETSGTIVYLPPEDHDVGGSRRMRAAGLPMPGVELKIVDDQGRAVAPYTVGEVVVRSPTNMAGYWQMPEATASTIDAQGWLHTGDAGYLDEDGYLFIHDRVKDLIISGGENIYPAEVENAVFGHPDVAEVAVIGVPDQTWGESVKAIVVLKSGAKANSDGIIAYARSRIAAFKAPKSVDFVDALPRNAAGKILKRQLREPYWKGHERQVH